MSVGAAFDDEEVGSVETEVELLLDESVTPASADVGAVCGPFVGAGVPVWSGGAAEPVVESLLGAATTESLPLPELDCGGGGGGAWPGGRTAYVQSLSSRTDWAPPRPVIGVRVTLQVCVTVPTWLCDGEGGLTGSAGRENGGKRVSKKTSGVTGVVATHVCVVSTV